MIRDVGLFYIYFFLEGTLWVVRHRQSVPPLHLQIYQREIHKRQGGCSTPKSYRLEIEYGGGGGVSIGTSTRVVDPYQAYQVNSVRDSGPGF